jgi:murein DD-endopeptidase MepM/ murein hydrolase activator NlpD
MPVDKVAPSIPEARDGSGSLTAPSTPALRSDQTQRDDLSVAASSPSDVTWTGIDGGSDPSTKTTPIKPASPPAPAPTGPVHVVTSGDNLWTIARRHSADLGSVLRWNEGVDPERLVAGQRILVPGGSKMAPLPRPSVVTPRAASARSAAVARPAAPRVQDGDHIWPLAIRGDLTRRFSSAHPGIDIAAPQGTPVRAVAEGTVVWAGWKDNGGGYVVEIEHVGGMRSTYNHNSKVTVERGDKVAQGDTIALVGATGWATGPHLDFRVWMGGRLIDPLDLY